MKLAEQVRQVISVKGQTIHRVDLHRDRLTRPELRRLLLGPTGNLRAPTLRLGKTLIVGFSEPLYLEIFE